MDQKRSLGPSEILIWADYKQQISVPLANRATGSMFYGTDRQEATVFGVVVVQNINGQRRQRNIFYLSSIIENTALMTAMLLDDLRGRLEGLASSNAITCWFDVGPHFRSYDLVAHLSKTWFSAMPAGGKFRLSWFAEHHGKGEVDSMFGAFSHWIQRHLAKPDVVIPSLDELMKVVAAAAEQAKTLEPPEQGGVDWEVLRFEQDRKPAQVWTMEQCDFQISKTYCVQLEEMFAAGNRQHVHFRNLFFSDLSSGEALTASVTQTSLAAAAGLTTAPSSFVTRSYQIAVY